MSFVAPNQRGPNARLEPEPGKRKEGWGLGQGIGKPGLTIPTAAMKSRAETETSAVKLDLAMRFRQDQRGTAETGNKKKL